MLHPSSFSSLMSRSFLKRTGGGSYNLPLPSYTYYTDIFYLFIYLFNVDPLSCLYFIQTSVLQTPVRTAEAALIRQMASSAHASCGTLGTTVAQNVIGFLFY